MNPFWFILIFDVMAIANGFDVMAIVGSFIVIFKRTIV